MEHALKETADMVFKKGWYILGDEVLIIANFSFVIPKYSLSFKIL